MYEKKQELLKISEAAKRLAVDNSTVLRWIEKGYIKSIQYPSGSHRIIKKDLECFIRRSKKQKSTFKILVIDDDHDESERICTILRESGIELEIESVADSLDAMLSIGYIKPDCIIIDEKLNGIDGITLALKIVNNARYQNMSIILLCNCCNSVLIQDKKIVDIVKKPFNPVELVEKVKSVLP